MKDTIDVAISFDTTGSMYPCLTQVRRSVERTVKELFDTIPNIRIAILTHGDYCDGAKKLTTLDFTDNERQLCEFIKNAPATSGGDSPECYELVLNKTRSLNWRSGKNRALVLIGDDVPHNVGYRYGGFTNTIDWKNEAGLLKEMGVNVYAVQALGYASSDRFYEQLADLTDGVLLELNQFAHVTDMLTAICYQRANQLSKLTLAGVHMRDILNSLNNRTKKRVVKKKTGTALHAVPPSRFQALFVDDDCSIKDFVEENGLLFNKGRGFYEFTKPVVVQDYKEVVIVEKTTGDMYTGNKARELLGIPVGVTAKVRPESFTKYQGFIQSTSSNRKLLSGTSFLYEVK